MVKHTFIHAQAHTQSDDDQCTRRSGLDCQREMFFNGCFITIFFDYCVRYSFHQCHTRRETLDIFLSIVKTIFKVEVYLRREWTSQTCIAKRKLSRLAKWDIMFYQQSGVISLILDLPTPCLRYFKWIPLWREYHMGSAVGQTLVTTYSLTTYLTALLLAIAKGPGYNIGKQNWDIYLNFLFYLIFSNLYVLFSLT